MLAPFCGNLSINPPSRQIPSRSGPIHCGQSSARAPAEASKVTIAAAERMRRKVGLPGAEGARTAAQDESRRQIAKVKINAHSARVKSASTLTTAEPSAWGVVRASCLANRRLIFADAKMSGARQLQIAGGEIR